jgi:hypothetical protein
LNLKITPSGDLAMNKLALILDAALLFTLTSCASDQYNKGQQGAGIGGSKLYTYTIMTRNSDAPKSSNIRGNQ